MTTLAMDIGGTKLAAALLDSNLQIRERRELPTPASKTPEALRAALQALVAPLQPRSLDRKQSPRRSPHVRSRRPVHWDPPAYVLSAQPDHQTR